MAQNKRRAFQWTGAREAAAFEVASDRINDAEIAKLAGVSRWTLNEWKNHPGFRARCKMWVDAWMAVQKGWNYRDTARHEKVKLEQMATLQERLFGTVLEAMGFDPYARHGRPDIPPETFAKAKAAMSGAIDEVEAFQKRMGGQIEQPNARAHAGVKVGG